MRKSTLKLEFSFDSLNIDRTGKAWIVASLTDRAQLCDPLQKFIIYLVGPLYLCFSRVPSIGFEFSEGGAVHTLIFSGDTARARSSGSGPNHDCTWHFVVNAKFEVKFFATTSEPLTRLKKRISRHNFCRALGVDSTCDTRPYFVAESSISRKGRPVSDDPFLTREGIRRVQHPDRLLDAPELQAPHQAVWTLAARRFAEL